MVLVRGAHLGWMTAMETNGLAASCRPRLLDALEKYWGYDAFLPLQESAMEAVLDGRDSVVVLPTGGGKSLCYQAPAVCLNGLAVVVSPLISLMKDQVDALRQCGVRAACLHSMLGGAERLAIFEDLRADRLQLLYISPERLLQTRILELLGNRRVTLVAVDEAHCISAWGHDFRPEYRQLRVLKEAFPQVAVHAYTATATEPVRADIAQQLGLVRPAVLVGSFDRPNLIFRVQRRRNIMDQIRQVLERHQGESGIIYCITRREVEKTAAALVEQGYRARPYHAGMSDEDRHRHQDEFNRDQIDTIVATVAFGMGIDKSNVRYVIHAGMPKSLEHYQQESGRAGRDGLEAECILFHSGQDYLTWQRLIDGPESAAGDGAKKSLAAIANYCVSVVCRHRTLSAHFDQHLAGDQCDACDVCLGEIDQVDDPLTVGQKVVSCVVRLEQRFGGDYTAMVLAGSRDQRILANGHDRLSTWGILQDAGKRAIRDWVEQLVGQGYLHKVGEYNVLGVTPDGWRLLRGERTPRLTQPVESKRARQAAGADSWQGVDRGLFEALRQLRRDRAEALGAPAYVVFGDAALRDMARRRPSSGAAFRLVKGVGQKKLEEYGAAFVARINEYCRAHDLAVDVEPDTARV